MSKYENDYLNGIIESILEYVEANHNVSRKDIIKDIRNNDGFYLNIEECLETIAFYIAEEREAEERKEWQELEEAEQREAEERETV